MQARPGEIGDRGRGVARDRGGDSAPRQRQQGGAIGRGEIRILDGTAPRGG